MKLSEFKAWFEGFTENIEGVPSAKQWERIKARISEITAEPTSYEYFMARYYRPYQPYWLVTDSPNPFALMNMASGDGRFALAGRAEAASLSES